MLEQNQTGNHEQDLTPGTAGAGISYADALENYRKNTDWWVVFAAFDLPDFEASPLWLSKRTGLSVEVVVEALEGLTVLGYLTKQTGAFYPVKGKNFVKIDVTGRSKAEVLSEHFLISQQILNQLNQDALVGIDHRCFASNIEILRDLYSDVAQAFEKAYKKSQDAKVKDRIFKMTFTAVDVLSMKGEPK